MNNQLELVQYKLEIFANALHHVLQLGEGVCVERGDEILVVVKTIKGISVSDAKNVDGLDCDPKDLVAGSMVWMHPFADANTGN